MQSKANRTPWRLVPLVVLALGMMSQVAHAERELNSLSNLLAESDLVLLGQVTQVANPGSDDEVASVDMIGIVKGNPQPQVLVRGTPGDAEGHAFRRGQALLLFLRKDADPQPGVYSLAGDGSAAIGIAHANPRALRDLIAAWLEAKGTEQRVNLLLPYLSAPDGASASDGDSQAVPLGLLAAASQDLIDQPQKNLYLPGLVDLACGRTAPSGKAAYQWSLQIAGTLQLEDARDCFDRILADARESMSHTTSPGSAGVTDTVRPVDQELVQIAVDSLVSLGGHYSAQSLQSTLTSLASNILNSCDPSLFSSVVLGIGQLALTNTPVNADLVANVAMMSRFRSLASTAVHALGLIQNTAARIHLERIAREHPDKLIRSQANITLARIGG